MKKFLILLIKFYQKCISPYLLPRCRYYPTCSEYMITAIHEFGAIKGMWLGICRILRCNPFNSKYGYDPTPKKTENKVEK